ncbi:MAG: M55 family metallopeptidase [Victivallales bacterium]
MKVYIQFDFEGVAGFVIRDNEDRNIPTVLDRTRRFMKIASAEVAAAANGAFSAGADEVVIWDSHGSGNTLLIEELPEKAELITGEYVRGPWLPFFEGADIGIYIGGHAMTGTPNAVTPHTRIGVNGRAYGEVGMFILECGSQGVPVVLVSGDTAVKREIADLVPQSEYVATKDAVGPTLAKSITPELSCKRIFEAAKRGTMNYKKMACCRVAAPYTFCFEKGEENISYTDPGSDFLTAYRRFLKKHFNCTGGWPEYNIPNESYGVD